MSDQKLTLFAQDASFSQKSGQHTYGLDLFWNGCAGRAERGLEVSLISLLDVERAQAFAVSAEQTAPHPEIKSTEKTATRIDFYLNHLKRTSPYFPASVNYGVFDGFYAKWKFVAGVCALGYQLISKLRSDADLLYLGSGEIGWDSGESKSMVTITLKCSHCGSDKLVRDGFTPKGKQRYWCHDCHRNSRDNPQPRGYPAAEKERILAAYEERSSLRGLERVFGVSRKTVSAWLKKKPPRSQT